MAGSKEFRFDSRKARLVTLLTTTALFGINPVLAQSLPTGGQVAAGSVTIGAPTNGALTVNQNSGNAVVNWQSFGIGQGNSVTFVQPDANSAILNRVTGSTTSTIAGQLSANGQVYLINPNGIAITATGTVNTGAFVASTLGISDDDFMAGKRTFAGNGASAAVTNAGSITIERGGYMALIGGSVENSGTITVPMGKAALGSGEQATLDLSGDGFLQVAIPTKAEGKQALVSNRGKISANGGTVQLKAAAAREMARQAVNMSGTIEARGVAGRSGDIVLFGGDGEVAVSGKVDAGNAAGKGGKIVVTGRAVKLAGAKLDASGRTGGGTIKIGGDRQGKGQTKHAETLTVDAATTIRADAAESGNGGDIVLWSDTQTSFSGSISARGGAVSGNGGEAEVSSHGLLNYGGVTDLSAPKGTFGTLLLDPYNIVISNAANTGQGATTSGGTTTFVPTGTSVINVATLQAALNSANVTVTTGGFGSAGTEAGDITVASAINWSSTNSLTLSAYRNINVNAAIANTGGANVNLRADNSGMGSGTVSFGGGIQVSTAGTVSVYYNPASNLPGSPSVNATSYTTATDYSSNIIGGGSLTGYMLVNNVYDLQNVRNNLSGSYALGRDIDASVTSAWNSGAGFLPIGNLTLNTSNYTISGTYFSGIFDGQNQAVSNLTINRPSTSLIGLFSGNSGQIRNFGVIGGAITGYVYVGGLVGQNYGTITNSFSGAAVSGWRYSGGLVGDHEGGAVRYSYATGNVSNTYRGQGFGGDSSGGLVGYNRAPIVGSYATGNVYGEGGATGGLVGMNNAAISQSYATGNVAGYVSGGLAGANAGPITQSYATGAVSATYNPQSGGLVGYDVTNGASVTDSYWDTQTTGKSNGIGAAAGTFQAVGLTTAQFANKANMPGLTFGTTPGGAGFVIIDADGSFNNASGNGATRPFLLSEYSTNIANAHQLQLAALAPSANYTLMRNIDIAAALGRTSGNWFTSNVFGDGYGFVPIGSAANFQGLFDGGGHTISNLSIVRGDATGLFGYIGSGGTIRNLGVLNAAISGNNNVGVIAGRNAGLITDVYSSGTVAGAQNAGGLVGINVSTISRSYSTASVAATGANAGGLVGGQFGTVSQSYAGGTVSGLSNVGGLVGISQSGAVISDAYATGAVTGISNSSAIGGLVGYNHGSIIRTYATGAVAGTTDVGGLVGYNSVIGSVTNSFWDTMTTGRTQGYGSNFFTFSAAGLTTAQLQDLSSYGTTFGGWDFQGVWAPPNQVGQNNGSAVAHYPELYAFLTVLTISPNAVTRYYGDVNPSLTATYYGNLRPGDSFATLANLFTSVGQFSNVGDYTITASGATVTSASGNTYRLVYIPGVLTVAARPLTVTADAKTRVYGDVVNPTLTYQVTGGSLLNGDVLTGGLSTLASSTTGVGNYAINQGTLGNSNYAITYVTANETITARKITITADAKSRYYGDANPTFTYAVGGSGIVNGDVLLGSLATSATQASGIGSYGISLGGLGHSNYEITAYTPANLLINARPITVAANAASRIYGAANPSLTYTVGGLGLANGDILGGALATSAVQASGVGNYGISQGNLGDPNYQITSFTGADLSITARPITVTADARTKIYGSADPSLGYTVGGNGLVNSDVLTGALTRIVGENVVAGGYAIGQGSITNVNNPNYAISYSGNTLTISPAPLTITPNGGQSKIYGHLDPTFGFVASGQVVNPLLGIDDSLLSFTGALGRIAGETVAGGSYGYTLNTLSAGANYALVVAANPASFAITPATLTITPNGGQSKIYGQTDPIFGYTANGQVVNPTLGLDDSGLGYAGKLGRVAGETVAGGPYGYTLNTLSAGSNYTLAMTANPARFAINPATLIITPDSGQSKVYGNADPIYRYAAGGQVVNAMLGIDDSGLSLTGALTRTAGETVTGGPYGYTLGMLSAGSNYTLALAANPASFAITPRAITVTANARNKVYGNADPALTYAVLGMGLVAGDTLTGTLDRTAGENVIAGGYAIGQGSITSTNNPNYAISYAGSTLTITPATLTITPDGGQSKIYGGADPTFGYSTSGKILNLLLGINDGSLVLSGALGRATGETVAGGPYAYTLNTLSAGANYTLAMAANPASFVITPATLTYTATAATRAYGNANPFLEGSVTGFVGSDTLASALSGTLMFSTGASSATGVGAYGINGSGLTANNGNYAFVQAAGNATALSITQRAITVTANAQNKIYGSADPTLGYVVGGDGLVNGDTLAGTLDRTTGENVIAGGYGIGQGSITSTNNPNYAISYAGSTLTITPATLTITPHAGQSKIYGGADPALFNYNASGQVVNAALGIDDNGLVLSGALGRALGETVAGGPYAYTLNTLSAGANYTLAMAANPASFVITPATLTYAANAATRAYGNANPLLGGSVTGFVGSDTPTSALSGTLTFSSSAGGTSGIGTYGVIGSGLTANNGNYAFVQAAGNATALSITPRAITVTANAQSKIYGSADPALGYVVGGDGLVNGDALSGALDRTAGEHVIAGGYAIGQGSITSTNNPNYAISYGGNTLTITPATLTYAASAASRQYGDANPVFSGIVTGFVNGDTLTSALSGTLAFSTSANGTSAVGGYGIVGSGLTVNNGNYVFVQASGNASALSITPRAIMVTANAQSRTYGDANPVLSYAVGGAGLVNGDTLSGSLASAAGATSNVGNYAITQGSLAASSNYAITYAGANLAVSQRVIAVRADTQTKTYGDANPTLTYSVTGLVNNDTLFGSLATMATQYADAGTYGIAVGSLANANYTISYTGANLTVTQRAIIVVADSLRRRYGLSNPALTYRVGGAGLVNGDTLSGSLATTATSLSEPGAYAVTQGTLQASANYSATFVPGILSVEPAASFEPGTTASSVVAAFDTGRFIPLRSIRTGNAETADGSRVMTEDPRFDGTVICFDSNRCILLPARTRH